MVNRVLVLACVAGLAVAPAANGKTRYLVPPGNSGISQYTEVVPTGGGGTPADRVPTSPAVTPASGAAHSSASQRELSNFVRGTAPHPSRPRISSPLGAAAPAGASVIGSVLRSAAGSGGGMGIALPLILVASALAAVGVLWQRRARS